MVTNEEINIEIAEFCGWRKIREQDYQPFGTNEYIHGPSQVLVGIHPESDVDDIEYEVIPVNKFFASAISFKSLQ